MLIIPCFHINIGEVEAILENKHKGDPEAMIFQAGGLFLISWCAVLWICLYFPPD